MTTASPSNIRELRYLTQTTMSTSFTAANASAWAADTANKIRINSFEDGNLDRDMVEDPTLRQRLMERSAPFIVKTKGDFTFSTFLTGANSDTSIPVPMILLYTMLGGIQNATQRTIDLDSSGTHTTTRLYASGIGALFSYGMAVLVGVKGDNRGDAEVRRVIDTDTDYIDLNMALKDAPIDGDTLVISTTIYYDPTPTSDVTYDFLAIGHAANDQKQMIGCQATGLELLGSNIGEFPNLKITMGVADWQNVPSGELDQLEPSEEMLGSDPISSSYRRVFFGDADSTTRSVFCGSSVSIPNLGVFYSPIQCINGTNGIGGWMKMRGDITASMNILFDEDSGIADDLTYRTDKQLLVQYGHTAQSCAAIELQRCNLNKEPKRTEVDGMSAREISLVANEYKNATGDLWKSIIRIHLF